MHEPKQDLSNHASRLSLEENVGKICQYEQDKMEQKYKEIAEIGYVFLRDCSFGEQQYWTTETCINDHREWIHSVPICPQHPV